MFLPHIAVAYGYAPSFSDPNALSFTMNKLFAPKFGVDLTTRLLTTLQGNIDNTFDGFSLIDFTTSSGEVFDIEKYLPEIQYALKLSPSVDFAASNFQSSDLFDALFPSSIPSVKAMGNFVKKKIIAKITTALEGLFDVGIDVPGVDLGLSVSQPILNGSGASFGVYTEDSTKLFPPVLDVDAVQVNDSSVFSNNGCSKECSNLCCRFSIIGILV